MTTTAESTLKVEGDWSTRTVRVNGSVLSPARSQKIRNHSPDGFNWGYGGSGPAQFALALLLHAGVPPRRAEELYQRFKFAVIAGLPQDDFAIEINVLDWAKQQTEQLVPHTEAVQP